MALLRYLHENGADLTKKGDSELALIHLAAQYGHLSVVDYLVKQQCDINVKDNHSICIYLIVLLFILLQLMVILVLLNIWLIKKLK